MTKLTVEKLLRDLKVRYKELEKYRADTETNEHITTHYPYVLEVVDGQLVLLEDIIDEIENALFYEGATSS